MRNLKFFSILVFLLCPLIKVPLTAESFPLTLYTYADSEKNFGAKITAPCTELRLATKNQKWNCGLSISTKKIFKNTLLTIKIGNLSGSGSISKLNNPAITNGTAPFSSGISEPSLTKASLPGYTNFSNQPGVFLQLGFENLFKKSASLEVSCWTPKNSTLPLSSILFSSQFFKKKLTIKLSSTNGLFSYKDNLSSSWFSDEPYYLAGKHFCSLNQFSLSFSGLYFSGSAAFYESPSGSIPLCLRSELKLSSRHSEAYILGFYNPKDGTITSSEKKLPSCAQIKSGFLLKSMILEGNGRQIFLKTGLNVHSTINFLQEEHPVRINAGLQASSANNTISINGSLNLSFYTNKKMDYKGCTLQLKDSIYFRYFNTGLSAAVTFTPSEKELLTTKYKLGLSLTNKAAQKINGSANLTLAAKNGEFYSKKITCGLTLQLKYKWINFTGKASADFDF